MPLKTIIVSFFLFFTSLAFAQKGVNWKTFLSRNDMVFDTLTTEWSSGAYTGNGLLGTMLYLENEKALRIDIGRSDVCDHRDDSTLPDIIKKSRLPIGHFVLQAVGKIKKITVRVDLWNAEVRAELTTDSGSIQLQILTLSQTDVILVQTKTTSKEDDFKWTWVAETSISPRVSFSYVAPLPDYKANPEPEIGKIKKSFFCYQPLLAGGSYTTVWAIAKKNNHEKTAYITTAFSTNDTATKTEALNTIAAIQSKDLKQLIQVHRDWWHHYYPQSFISIPDRLLESFYWIQQYKLASATRAAKPAIDLLGPWFARTPWPTYWFNLNLQLTYSPLYTANRLNIAQSLIEMIHANKANLVKNVPDQYQYDSAALGRAGGQDMLAPVELEANPTKFVGESQSELGNLTWLLYYYWQHYRYSMDKQVAANLFPILKRSINYYLHLMTKDENGKWHLSVKTHSPEYPKGNGYDTNYSLSTLKWGCKIVLQLNEQLQLNDSMKATWQDLLANTTPYPHDENGFMIAAGIPFSLSHRHFSHLFMIYPFYEINWDQPENREIIQKSLAHWHSFPSALQGYSYTAGASIYAMMGNGNQARDYLQTLLQKFVKPNTMYMETGPVIETPLAACASLQEMVLQYWNNTLRVFPAIPTDWEQASFENFRTDGAFLISAVRKKYRTQWIKIESLKGGTLQLQPNMQGTIQIKSNCLVEWKNQGNLTYTLTIPKGESVVLYTSPEALKIKTTIISDKSKLDTPFGLKRNY